MGMKVSPPKTTLFDVNTRQIQDERTRHFLQVYRELPLNERVAIDGLITLFTEQIDGLSQRSALYLIGALGEHLAKGGSV